MRELSTSLKARAAYGAARQGAPRTPRAIEYDLFAAITAQLRTAADRGDHPALAAALDRNRRLWTTLMVDIANADNALPTELRANLISLGSFTLSHTSAVLDGSGEAEALIEINTSVMRGLAGERGGE